MSTRFYYALQFMIACLLLASGLYIQYVDGFEPCPLCTLQRVCFIMLGLFFFIGILLSKKRRACTFVNTFVALFCLVGFSLAARQTWLQHFPPIDGGECGVSLQYMLEVLPLNEVANKILAGSAECTQRSWELFSLSMPEWAMGWFGFFFLLTSRLFARTFKSKR